MGGGGKEEERKDDYKSDERSMMHICDENNGILLTRSVKNENFNIFISKVVHKTVQHFFIL